MPLLAVEVPLQLQLNPSGGDYCAAVQLWDGPLRCVEAWSITECSNMKFDRKHSIFSMTVARTSNCAKSVDVSMVVVDGIVAGRHILPTLGMVHPVSVSNKTAWRARDATNPQLTGAAFEGYKCFPVLLAGQLHQLHS